MQKANVFSKLAVLSICFALLAGCGGGDSKPSSSPNGSNPQAASPSNPKDMKAQITVWTWEPRDNQKKIIDDFNKDYPGIDVTFTNVESRDMVTKLQTAMASGADLPDVVWLESANRGKLIDLNIWEDLSGAPYNVKKEDLLDFMIPLSTTKEGKLVGIEVSPPFAGLSYKRDLAKKYLGTDDPVELEKLLKDWNAFTEKGKQVKEQSGGTVFMFTGVSEIISIAKGQNTIPLVKDGKLNIKESLTPIFSLALNMQKAGIVDKLEGGAPPAYLASYAAKKHIFYPAATWAPTYRIKANDKNGSGNWGIMGAPGGGFLNGGTIVAIPQKAKNKQAAFEYIKWMYLSEKGAISNRDHLEYFNTLKSTYKDPKFYSKTDAFFGGQDVLKKFAEIAPSVIVGPPVTKYDKEIIGAIDLAVKTMNSNEDGALSVDTLISSMEKDILSQVPELKK
ncbi:ABC transporter substrate-binding protein [Paenibacillus piri]|uniref:Extracellular solute-binding protein n=1 Tax=Paenibacillus piri TaxID=2547395 RepID=A0A4R5KIT0_9BACL|nr:extracellular solute-binding protein [Paenibacillus piri]TDF95391.1 extracellular solute-binding protein [Paenibacillus piri]